MAEVPPPPVLGPLTIPPSNAAPPGESLWTAYGWNNQTGRWISIQAERPWDMFPAGYYASSFYPPGVPVIPSIWDEHTVVAVCTSRTMPDGTAAPYVLEPPPIGVQPSLECPPGMFLVIPLLHDLFGAPAPACALTTEASLPQNQCPPGTQWDPVTETCKAVVIPPPIFPLPPGQPLPPPPTTPETGQPDPQGDEITYELCTQMWAMTTTVVDAIQQLQMQQGGSPDPACCDNVVLAIRGVVSSLNSILALLPQLAGTAPPTVTVNAPVTVNVPAQPPATVTVNAPGTDVSQIVAELKNLVGQGDVDQVIIDALQQQGLITSADQQVLQGIKWSDAIAYALSSSPVRAIWKFIKQIGGDADTIATQIAQFANPGVNFAENLVNSALTTQRNLLWSLITPVLDQVKSSVKPAGAVSLGQIGVNPDQALADIAATMASLKELAILIALFREGAGEQFEKLGEKVLAILGLEEIREVQLGPLVRNGMAKVADYQAKAIFRQEIPGATSLMGYVAQGLLAPADIAGMLDFNGLAPLVRPAMQAASYRGFNARQMLRLIETNLYTQADIADELTFSGMRPVSQHRLLLAAPYLATNPQRTQLRSALEAAHVAGLLSDTDLTLRIDSAENNTDRDSLILERVKLLELEATAKALETEYTIMFTANMISDATYRSYLAGIGLQQWKIDALAGVAEAKANAAVYRKELAAAAALERATAAEERKTAMQAFKSGVSDSTALAAALVLTGLTPTQAAAWVSLATLQQSGSLRWIYGVLKSPPEAALLRQRVTALADQRKRLQIPDASFVQALQAMGIPDRVINALRAATDAMISPKTAAVTIPVQTN